MGPLEWEPFVMMAWIHRKSDARHAELVWINQKLLHKIIIITEYDAWLP